MRISPPPKEEGREAQGMSLTMETVQLKNELLKRQPQQHSSSHQF